MNKDDNTPPNRLIFVTHDYSTYGAATSLKSLISKLDVGESTLIVQKPLVKRRVPLDNISRRFNFPKERILFCVLPMDDNCERGFETFLQKIYRMLINIRWLIFKSKTQKYITNLSPWLVHLNSLTLSNMVTKKYRCVLHVRERCLENLKHIVRLKTADAAGVIFIDETTRSSLPLPTEVSYCVLPNPVSLSDDLQRWTRTAALQCLGIEPTTEHIFAVVGRMNEEKGVAFIVEVFSKIKNMNAILLLIGTATNERDRRKIAELTENDSRVKFCGEVLDPGLIYSAIDTVIRGENKFCQGRTTLESLFSGGRAIIPGTPNEVENDPVLNKFLNRIFPYSPRDDQSLYEAIELAYAGGTMRSAVLENSENYARDFLKFCASLPFNSHDAKN